MRPIRLKMRGLRSYRAECEIDLSKAELLAIIGDTGAGKSSILEAITYALYNATTWDARAVKQLISDGAQTVTVELEFSSSGQTYRVTRSTSREQYPPSVHKLECLSDPEVPRYDGQERVNAEIVRMIGLDYKAFTSAVILPQGRFQTLLQSTAADRTAILRGIFRVDELTAVREKANLLLREFQPHLENLRVRRARLLDDPSKVEREAAQRVVRAEARTKQLQAFDSKYSGLVRKADEEAATSDRLVGAVANIEEAMTGGAQRLDQLVAKEKAAAVALAELQKREQTAKSDENNLRTALDEATQRREGVADLVQVRSVLERLTREQPSLTKEELRLGKEASRLQGEDADLARRSQLLESLLQSADAAELSLKKENERATEATERLEKGKAALQSCRQAAKESIAAQRAMDAAALGMKRANETLAKHEEGLSNAIEHEKAAAAELRVLQKRDAAAHAAQGLSAGEACPVCGRALSPDFVAPTMPAINEAEERAKRAADEANAAREGAAGARADVNGAKRNIKLAEDAASAATRELEDAMRALRQSVPKATLDDKDAAVLSPLLTASNEAREKARLQALSAGEQRSQADRAEAELDARSDGLEQQRAEHTRATQELAERKAGLETARGELPETFRPAEGSTKQAVSVLDTKVRKLLADRERQEGQLRTVREALDKIGKDRSNLEQRRRVDIETPRREIENGIVILSERIGVARKALGRTTKSAAKPQLSSLQLDRVAKLAAAVEVEGAEIREELRSQAEQCAKNADEVREQASFVLKEAALNPAQSLQNAIVDATAEVKMAREERETARRQKKEAKDLDQRVKDGSQLVDLLGELTAQLTDGRFIGHVVRQKQQTLLAVASDILGTITAGRYGFADDFSIVDRTSGQPRSSKALSGGETFLASLALALGLVELAGRSGGRLEALFFDEGFGTLDAGHLDEAIGELERRASAGRLVAVISHLRALAERVETVLSVTNSPTGSTVRWIGPAERDAMVSEEIEQGLLS